MVGLVIHCLSDETNINTHSFQIGGASAAASGGVTDSTIHILGRLTSDAYQRSSLIGFFCNWSVDCPIKFVW